jgi:hypothetical protein
MTYRVVVTREDDAWLGDVPGMQGAHTFSPTTLAMLDTYMREVTIDDDLPDEAMADLEFAWVLEMSDDDLVDALAQDRGVPRTEIVARGWSLTDLAAILKVPVERVTHVPPPRASRVAR